MTPLDEVMRALDDMVRAGKVLYVGISDAPAWVVSRANTMAELRGWTPFVGLQIQYSLVERTVERELIPMARALDLGVTAWGPLGQGVLSGKYTANPQATGRANMGGPINERNLAIANEVVGLAKAIGRTPSQVALNWLRQQPGVVIPIIGAKTLDQLRENLGCVDFQLTRDQMQSLSEVSRIDLGFPQEFITSEGIRELVFGGTFSKIDFHR